MIGVMGRSRALVVGTLSWLVCGALLAATGCTISRDEDTLQRWIAEEMDEDDIELASSSRAVEEGLGDRDQTRWSASRE